MNNNYKIINNIVYVDCKNIKFKIDIETLDLLKDFKTAYITSHGYVCFAKNNNHFYLHRLITNVKSGQYVDHINGDKLDNRKCNLRITNNITNVANRQKLNINNTSGYIGVTWSEQRKKWVSQIMINRKMINLGRYIDKEKAILTSKYARIILKKVVYDKNDIKYTLKCMSKDLKLYIKNKLRRNLGVK